MKGLVLDAVWDPKPDYQVSEWEKETGKAITGNSIWRHPKLEVRDWPDPKPGPKEVVLEIQACGVCGSDMHFYETDEDDYILYPGLTRFPTILGHEFSGKVVELGPEVETLKVGDMVTVEEMIWCGRCIPCRNGYPNHCTNLEEIGFTIPGAFANYIAVDEKFCWKIDGIAERFGDEEKAYEVGALSEPTSVAYNAMFERGGGFRPGHYVSVFGTGPIGLAAIGLAKAAGAGIIAAFEISPQRRELAKAVGADYVYDPREVNPGEVLMELSKGEGFNFHVEAAGAPHLTVPEMEKALAINGKIVQIGRAAKRVPMYLEALQVRRSQVFGAQGHSGHETFPNVIRMVAAGRLDLSPIITARYKLDEAVDAIARSTSRTDGKILVKPNW
ncbi:MAG TPA: alcohol dehydrogenase catalytic domain-containing protein [Thermoflexia bacterium]|nr:MAG: alcohol dehydrogenase [Chloroflexota bacterium]HEY67528.1 alcohol dehydrogenase catalytic domain-containing protein [Thermoflexia bacterium]